MTEPIILRISDEWENLEMAEIIAFGGEAFESYLRQLINNGELEWENIVENMVLGNRCDLDFIKRMLKEGGEEWSSHYADIVARAALTTQDFDMVEEAVKEGANLQEVINEMLRLSQGLERFHRKAQNTCGFTRSE